MSPLNNRLRSKVPIRVAFRLQRLFLTPSVRRIVGYFVPFGILAVSVCVLLFAGDNYARLAAQAESKVRAVTQRPENLVEGMRIVATSAGLHAELAALVTQSFPAGATEFDADELRRRAEQIPAVKSASVRIDPGGLLTLKVAERMPAVIWRNRDSLALLDEEGEFVTVAGNRASHMELPLITGPGAESAVPEAVQIVSAAKGIKYSLRGLNRVGQRRWDLVLDGGRRVLLPAKEPVEAVRRLMTLEATELLLQRRLLAVDLRETGRTAVRLTPQSQIEFRKMRSGGGGQ